MTTLLAAPIRSRQPLTLDQIRKAAPSAFAAEAYSAMSDRYAYIPTAEVIEGMRRYGFLPFAASQSLARVEDKREHTKHMIRFRREDQALSVVGETLPEIVLINSHDGSSAYKLMAGLFRLVCSNGLIIADSMIASINVRHSGRFIDEVVSASIGLAEGMPSAMNAIADWQRIELSSGEQMAYAEAAHVLRFANAEGEVNTPIQPKQLLAPRRRDDSGSDLYSVFNRVQENVMKGGLTMTNPTTFRRTSTRAVKAIDSDVKLNRALWTLTERMAALRN